ncbi:class III lanthipeptide [Dactylosporangium sp. NPDC051485]
MSVLKLQSLPQRVADNSMRGNSCSSSTSNCCTNVN